MDLTAHSPGQEHCIVFDTTYEEESRGHRVDMPVIHLFGRNEHGEPRHVEVEGFRPCFFISYGTFADHVPNICNDRRVLAVEVDLSALSASERESLIENDPGISIGSETGEEFDWTGQRVAHELSAAHGATVYDTSVFDQLGTAVGSDEPLVRIITKVPGDVGGSRGNRGLRSAIEDNWGEKTWEADIPFTRRFLISTGIYRGFKIDDTFENGTARVRYENWDGASNSAGRVTEIEPADAPVYSSRARDQFPTATIGDDVRPRVLTADIEVLTHGGGVPDPLRAKNEVSAITAHDSYTDLYRGWFLRSDTWDDSVTEELLESEVADAIEVETDVSIWDDESAMLDDFNSWVTDKQFDLVTGWNSEGFDYPYLIQRSYEKNAWNIRGWDELGNPGVWDNARPGEDSDVTYRVDGMVQWDMLDGYKKSLFRDVSSYKLDDVAATELDFGKAPIDELDEAWRSNPIDFVVYNTRDVEAVVEIERASSLFDLYEHMRSVAGADLTDLHNPGPMIDTLFLRRAYENEIALPSNVRPDVGDFHGAHVFDPVPGIHRNVVYPDLASLYPFILWTLNVSPETYIHTDEELERSPYDEDDVFTVYVDKRGFKTIPKGDDASIDRVDTDKYKGILDESGSLRSPPGMFEPRYDEAYMIKPDVEEGFIRETVDELVDMKYEYKGQGVIYDAVKRVTNSVWGVLGDSASMGNGFRLFDWRLGETITLGGRKVIQYTASEYTRLINEYAVDVGCEPNSYLVGGDTDSVMTSVPSAPDYQTALMWALNASEEFLGTPEDPGLYDYFMEDEFDVIIGEDEHRMDVEIESLASKLFFKQDYDRPVRDNVAVKKRYAQHGIWDETHGWIASELKDKSEVTLDDYENGVLSDQEPADNLSITGFEYVRSDIAPLTKDVQEYIFTQLTLNDEYEDAIYTYLEDVVESVKQNEVSLDRIGRTAGIGQPLDDYGWKTYDELVADNNYEATLVDERNGGRYVSTPGPAYRGLKYAIDHFAWQDTTTKAVRIYIDNVRPGPYPEVYKYTTFPRDDRPDPPEVGREVDAIATDSPDRLPDEFVPDYEKMLGKEVRDNVTDILRTVGMDWGSVVGEGRQSDLDQFL